MQYTGATACDVSKIYSFDYYFLAIDPAAYFW